MGTRRYGGRHLNFSMDRILSRDFSPDRRNRPKFFIIKQFDDISEGNDKARQLPLRPLYYPFPVNYGIPQVNPNSIYEFSRTNFGGSCNSVVRPAPIRPLVKGTTTIEPTATSTSISTKQNNETNNRRRSWSRAVFSSLQRKGLERRFAIQKYITKPDRRQLAATLGLSDAQVKVWFQNRRMKWRHSKESEKIDKATNDKLQRSDHEGKDTDEDEDIDVGSNN